MKVARINIGDVYRIANVGDEFFQVKVVGRPPKPDSKAARPPLNVAYVRRRNGRGAWSQKENIVSVREFNQMISS